MESRRTVTVTVRCVTFIFANPARVWYSRASIFILCICSLRNPRLRLALLYCRSRARTCTYAHSQPSITRGRSSENGLTGEGNALWLSMPSHNFLWPERRMMERDVGKHWAAQREKNTGTRQGVPTSEVDDTYLPQAPPSWNWIPTCGGWGDGACSAGEVPAFGRYRDGSCLFPVLR